jgi:hypothetical protein
VSVRVREVRVVEIWPWSAGEAVEGAEEKVSRSRRREVDCLRAELKRGFCSGVRGDLRGDEEGWTSVPYWADLC